MDSIQRPSLRSLSIKETQKAAQVFLDQGSPKVKQTPIARGNIGKSLDTRGTVSYENYAQDLIARYQQDNPHAQIALNDSRNPKLQYVHPTFTFFVLQENRGLPQGDLVHFIRSLKNLVEAKHMPYGDRWLAALCILSSKSNLINEQDRLQVLAALDLKGTGIDALIKNPPEKNLLKFVKELSQKADGEFQKNIKETVKKADAFLEKHPELQKQNLDSENSAITLKILEEVPNQNLDELDEIKHLHQVPQNELAQDEALSDQELHASKINAASMKDYTQYIRENYQQEGAPERDIQLHKERPDLMPAASYYTKTSNVVSEQGPGILNSTYNLGESAASSAASAVSSAWANVTGLFYRNSSTEEENKTNEASPKNTTNAPNTFNSVNTQATSNHQDNEEKANDNQKS